MQIIAKGYVSSISAFFSGYRHVLDFSQNTETKKWRLYIYVNPSKKGEINLNNCILV
jgi:hypothetical protein